MKLTYDLILAAVILLCAFQAARRGFVHTLVRFIGLFASVALAAALHKTAAQNVYGAFLRQPIWDMIQKTLAEAANPESLAESVVSAIASLPAFVSSAIDLDVEKLAQWMQSAAGLPVDELTTSLVDTVVGPIILSLLQVILFLLIFALASAFVRMLAGLFTGINKIPVVGQLNWMLGGILGVLQGILIVYVACVFLQLALLLSGDSLPLISRADIEATVLLKYFFTESTRVQQAVQEAIASLTAI